MRYFMTMIIILLLSASDLKAQFAGGSGSESDPYQISTLEQLQQIKDFEASNYAAYRAPALVVSNEGTILAFTEGRIGTWQDDGAMDDIILRRSTDGGKTWGQVIIVAEDGENSCKTPVPVVLPSGRILLIYTWNEYHEDSSERDTREVYITHSDDDGLSWSEPQNITDQVYEDDWGWYGTGPGHGIVKEREPHKGRIIIPARHNIRGVQRMTSHIIYSDDDGETWEIGALALRHPKSSNESTAVELSNGDIMLNSRNGTDDENHRVVSISSDGGETFHAMYLDSLLLDPPAQGTLLKHSFNEETGKYNILFSNPHSGEQGVRVNGTIKLSHDDGETWSTMFRYSDPYPTFSSYSDIAVINEDGDIGVLFERGAQYMPREMRWDGVAFRIIRFEEINIPITPDFYEDNHYENPNWNIFEVEGNDLVFDATSNIQHFQLVAHIDASETANWNGGHGFEPLGDGDGAFSGSFDGNGYTISNLMINRSNEARTGLFGTLGTGVIKNVTLENVSVSGNDNAGALVGVVVGGEVRNSSASGSVSGNHRVGGLVGDNQVGMIRGSYASVEVLGERRAGGLIGQNRDGGIITASYATGNVSINSGTGHDAGGLAGANTYGEIHDSYATGDIYAIGRRVGGLVGQSHDASVITNSYARGNVYGADNMGMVGGLIGRNRQESTIHASYATGTVQSEEGENFGGFAGLNDQDGEIFDSFWDLESSGNENGVGGGVTDGVTGLTTSQMSGTTASEHMTGFDFAETWKLSSGYPALYWQKTEVSTSISDSETELPSRFVLRQNYPNPFNPVTVIPMELPESAIVKLEVYNSLGQKVAILVNEYLPAGTHTINFEAQHLASGVYLYRMHAGEFIQTKRMLLLK